MPTLKPHLSVADVMGQLEELHGLPVQVEGILTTSRNGSIAGYELLSHPRIERRAEIQPASLARSSLWLEFGNGSVQPNRPVLGRWVGKRVRVHGVIWRPKQLWVQGEAFAMSDPSAWQAHLQVYSVQRVTSEQRRQGSV